MASPLENFIRDEVHKGFQGKLLVGTYRYPTGGSSLNAKGDISNEMYLTTTCNGIVEKYSDFIRATAGIPDSDVKVLIIQKSLSVTPQKDHQVKFRDIWYQLRSVEKDPANATWVMRAFIIQDPTV